MSSNFPNNMNTSNTFPNAQYAPFGTNDNNFNRRSMPSNMFPIDGGLNGNFVGRFNPLSTNTEYLMNQHPIMSNFQQAFEPNAPLIEKMDYTNKNNLIHNNVGDNVLDEHIVEYRLLVDSLDRDIKYYPNPFHFTVQLNPISTSVRRDEEYIDHKKKDKGTKTIETRFESQPPPYINKEFINVKYVKLENVILPQCTKLKVKLKDELEFDPGSNLVTDRFVSMVIKELECDRVYTTFDTNSRIDKYGAVYTSPVPFAVIIPDKLLGLAYYSGTSYYGSIIYKNSLLANLNKLTVSFYDSNGLPLINGDVFSYDKLEEYEFENGEPLSRTDLRHPLNKRHQVFFSLIVGVVESQINTHTKFET
jgi:hypothetical protein